MPLEQFRGSDFGTLLARARAVLGEDAVIVSVRRDETGGRGLVLVAADPDTAMRAAGGKRPSRPGADTARPLARSRLGMPLIVAVVGPTGAGKTTTVAKLANHPRVFGGWPVGLLCLDTYRIGAIEQLKTYAELSSLPIEVAYDADEVAPAVRRMADCEVILVDTAGRGPRQASEIAALLQPLRGLGPVEVHLALPAGMRPEWARRVLAHHRPLGVTHLIPTKLDEFPEDDVVYALVEASGLASRWACDGQEVPNDLDLVHSKRPQPMGVRA